MARRRLPAATGVRRSGVVLGRAGLRHGVCRPGLGRRPALGYATRRDGRKRGPGGPGLHRAPGDTVALSAPLAPGEQPWAWLSAAKPRDRAARVWRDVERLLQVGRPRGSTWSLPEVLHRPAVVLDGGRRERRHLPGLAQRGGPARGGTARLLDRTLPLGGRVPRHLERRQARTGARVR